MKIPGGSPKIFRRATRASGGSLDAACAALSATDCPKSWRPVTRKTFARLAAWKQRKIVAALRKPRPPPAYHFPHRAPDLVPMKPADVVALPWDSDASRGGHALVVGAERSEEGSTGVYFVELTGRRVFVIKVTRPDQFIPELFGNALAKCFDVPAPDMQPVGRHTPLGRAIIEGLLRFEAKMHNHEKYWISSKLQIISSFAHHFFFIMEYVPGKSLFEADQLESEKTEAAAEKGSASAEEAKRDDWLRSAVRSDPSLESFGSVVALDMILNNLDRVPRRSWPSQTGEHLRAGPGRRRETVLQRGETTPGHRASRPP